MKAPSITSTSGTAEPVDVLAWMSEHWPHLAGVPLAIGIRQQLQPHLPDSISDRRLRRALGRYTGQNRYLVLLAAEGSQRVALDGSTTPVSDEHRQHARERLLQRQTVRQANRVARHRRHTTAPLPVAVLAAASPPASHSVDKLGRPVLSLKMEPAAVDV